jgi:hypothetical protein
MRVEIQDIEAYVSGKCTHPEGSEVMVVLAFAHLVAELTFCLVLQQSLPRIGKTHLKPAQPSSARSDPGWSPYIAVKRG